ncbi:MAG: outer membrane beta-barrel protein [Desulfuromonadales bacterium]|nr:outer membrane beta-barrel protein [Desulfuromonadales bacterium]
MKKLTPFLTILTTSLLSTAAFADNVYFVPAQSAPPSQPVQSAPPSQNVQTIQTIQTVQPVQAVQPVPVQFMQPVRVVPASQPVRIVQPGYLPRHRPGPYFSIFLGATVPTSETLSTTDYLVPSNSNDYKLDYNAGFYTGGTGGYDFGTFRLEGELSYRYADINKITPNGGVSYGNPNRGIDSLAVMFNGWYDFRNESPVTPYIGAGIGIATLSFDKDYFQPRSSGSGPNLNNPVFYQDTTSAFAWQVGAGVEIELNRLLSLDLAYRYLSTASQVFNKYSDLENSIKFSSHNFSVGLRFKY